MKSRIPGLINAISVFATLRLAIILLVQGAIWGQGAPLSYDFVTNGIREAHVDTVNGIARLISDGSPCRRSCSWIRKSGPTAYSSWRRRGPRHPSLCHQAQFLA